VNTRALLLTGVLAGLFCLGFVLLYTGFPQTPQRLYIFAYLLRAQDVPGAALVIFIAIAAGWPPLGRAGLALVEAIGRQPWATTLITFLVLCAGQLLVGTDYPLAGDEHLILLQARAFAAGRLTAQFPPELVSWLVPRPYIDLWLYASPQTGAVVSVVLAGVRAAARALRPAGHRLGLQSAARSRGARPHRPARRAAHRAPPAAGWAMLLTLASPAFAGMALGYFSMTAHLFFNLLYVWLLLERRLLLAGVVARLRSCCTTRGRTSSSPCRGSAGSRGMTAGARCCG
jgi:hypothetical protein